MTFHKPPKGRRATYRVSVDRSGLQLEVDEDFWDDTVVDHKKGHTALDINIAQVIQEIRAALYYIGTEGTAH